MALKPKEKGPMETNQQYQTRINAEATEIYQYCQNKAIQNMPFDNIATDGDPYDIQKETLSRVRVFISEKENKKLHGIYLPNRQYWYDIKEAITAMYLPASMLVKKS